MRITTLLTVLFILCSCGKECVDNNLNNNQTTLPVETTLNDFVLIESPGQYTFLADSNNKDGGESVAISCDYYMGKYAVTNREWAAYIADTNRKAPKYWTDGIYPSNRGNHPVLWVSYDEAVSYCQWLSAKSDYWNYRLPTQAEWEYAAVGQNRRAFPWGDNAGVEYSKGLLKSNMNYNGVIAAQVLENPNQMATYIHEKSTRYGEQDRVSDIISISGSGGVIGWVDHLNYLGFIYTDLFAQINNAGGNTCAVDGYPEGVSWCGCYNMCGNCWEWTSTVEVAQNGAEKGQEVNIIRGGSWYANASSCRASFRGEGRKPTSAYNTVGFRLVAEPKK